MELHFIYQNILRTGNFVVYSRLAFASNLYGRNERGHGQNSMEELIAALLVLALDLLQGEQPFPPGKV